MRRRLVCVGTNRPSDAANIQMLENRLRLLFDAIDAFARSTSDYDRLVVTVATRMADLMKNTCVVQLLSDDGTMLTPVAIQADDPVVVQQVRQVLTMNPVRVGHHALYAQVVATGESLLVPHIDLEAKLEGASGPHRALTRSLGMRSGLMVPLRVQGRCIGVVSLGRYDPALPPFGPDDERLAQTLADHAALAISNARLHAEAQHQRARSEAAEKALATSQLQQAQKMEAIGRLASGVAHDFNNILTVILSYAELLSSAVSEGDPLRADVEEIRAAGVRGTDLTRQLLAFGRRQVLEPRALDMNALVAGTHRMLTRLVGESVTLSFHPAPDLGAVRVDATQLEQVVVNLVINARDAMPDGGTLTVETANVRLDANYALTHLDVAPGPYVMLAVTDSGQGMEAGVRERIFEPFFTTKESGKGTGLGLATVFGIVRQSDGHIWAYSEPGAGTTFKVYFPRVDAPAHAETIGEPQKRATSGSETILLVEDDDGVRGIAGVILRRFGYDVVEAPNGEAAIGLCRHFARPIHLLITDLVMPQMGGRSLAESLATSRPQMKVLYMSGYADNGIVQQGHLDASAAFLQKPLTPSVLAAKVREVLDAPVS